MKTILYITILSFVVFHFGGYSQSYTQNNDIKKPDYIPQSPVAAAYARYGEIPVDYSTGVPGIEIPIYSIKVGDVSVPISISYHASGIKVKDIPSEVGLGWVLNIGGNVTANILGAPDVLDLKPFNYKKSDDVDNLIRTANVSGNTFDQSMSFFDDLNKKKQEIYGGYSAIDYYSDRFSYSLPTGESGVFRKDFVNDSIRLLPFRPVNVKLNLNSIDILSPNGTLSRFSKCDYDLYMPTKIISPNKIDSLIYYYGSSNVYPTYNIVGSYSWTVDKPEITPVPIGEPNYEMCNQVFPGSGTQNGTVSVICGGKTQCEGVLPDSIASKYITIKFTYAADRTDLNAVAHNKRLSKIEIKDKITNNIIRSFQFYQSYFGNAVSNNKRLKLDSVAICGSDSKKYDRYSFKYNSMLLPPYPSMEQGYLSEDYWGYYNGANNSYPFPVFINDLNIPGLMSWNTGNREPDSLYMKACLIKEITYPTGGKTIFDFEANNEGNPALRIGGVRIARITSYLDNSSKAFVRDYKYGGAIYKEIESIDYGYLDRQVHEIFYANSTCDRFLHYATGYESYFVSSESLAPITNSNGTPVMYNTVEEYIGDGNLNTGEILYEYKCKKDEESIYSTNESYRPRYVNSYHNDFGNYQPLLLKKTIYKNQNNTYTPVKCVENDYREYKVKEFNSGLVFDNNTTLEIWDGDGATYDSAMRIYTQYNSYLSSLHYLDTKGHEDISLLKSTIEWEYNNGLKTLAKTTQYDYDNFTQISKKTEVNSNNENLYTSYKYPYQFSESGNIYKTMMDKYMISPVIETVEEKGTKPIQAIKTNYTLWNNSIIAPSTVNLSIGTNDPETKIVYNDYDDKGNVTQYTQSDGKVVTLFWAYNKSLPVAKIESDSILTISASFRTDVANHIYDAVGQKDKIDLDINFLKSKLNDYMTNANCMVTLYTYKPLVGMTSQTTPNGITTYYNYDSFNRLQNIKDNQDKLINKYDYHYYNQAQ